MDDFFADADAWFDQAGFDDDFLWRGRVVNLMEDISQQVSIDNYASPILGTPHELGDWDENGYVEILRGQDTNDIIYGRREINKLIGRAGGDVFVMSGNDSAEDFNVLEGDRIFCPDYDGELYITEVYSGDDIETIIEDSGGFWSGMSMTLYDTSGIDAYNSIIGDGDLRLVAENFEVPA